MLLPKGENKPEVKFYKYPKVDSFDLYRNYVGEVILKSIIPKNKKISLSRGHFANAGVLQIKNAQNREYEKKRQEHEENLPIGDKLLTWAESSSTLGFMQAVFSIFDQN